MIRVVRLPAQAKPSTIVRRDAAGVTVTVYAPPKLLDARDGLWPLRLFLTNAKLTGHLGQGFDLLGRGNHQTFVTRRHFCHGGKLSPIERKGDALCENVFV